MIEKYIEIGTNKTKNKPLKTFILAILAGTFIALAGVASTVVTYKIANPSLAKLLSGIIFPIGLFLVILLQTELFTGNSLLVIPLLDKKIKLKKLLKNWLLVFLGNLVGAIIIAIIIYYSGLLNSSNNLLGETFVKIAISKCSLTFIKSFLLGFLCNILVCIAVYLSCNKESVVDKVICIFLPISLFIILSLEHSVANMYYLSIGFLSKTNPLFIEGINAASISIKNILLNNLIPVTIGNIVGGSLFGLTMFYINKKK